MADFIQSAAQYGVPTFLLLVLLWRHREDMRDCREDRNRLWSEIVRLATKLPPDPPKGKFPRLADLDD